MDYTSENMTDHQEYFYFSITAIIAHDYVPFRNIQEKSRQKLLTVKVVLKFVNKSSYSV